MECFTKRFGHHVLMQSLFFVHCEAFSQCLRDFADSRQNLAQCQCLQTSFTNDAIGCHASIKQCPGMKLSALISDIKLYIGMKQKYPTY